MLLAGDIGGTKVHLGLLERRQGTLKLLENVRYPTQDYPDFETVLEQFLKETGAKPTEGCIGAAGPVEGRHCQLTNLPWTIEADDLQNRFGLKQLLLVNDLALVAASIPYLTDTDVEVIQTGIPESGGRKAVVSPGTGLGQAFLVPGDAGLQRVWDTEGGQCDWAPTNSDEVGLFQYLLKRRERVSIEQVLSGPGLQTLYAFYRDVCGEKNSSQTLSAEEICLRGASEESGSCRETLNRFLSVLGAVCGNLVLQIMARGGVYIGGGIVPKIETAFFEGVFLEAFRNKGAFRDFMKTIPAYRIRNENAPLLGAAGLVAGGEVQVADW